MGVGAVLCCHNLRTGTRRAKYDARGIGFLQLRMEDTQREDLTKFLSESGDFLERYLSADTGILVHCQVGANRSVAIVVAYLVLREGFKLIDAIETVARSRGHVLGSGSFQL